MPTNEYRVYAAYLKDEQQLMKSSSGGVFYGMAQYIIQMGGVVFGAALNNAFKVQHQVARTVEELNRLRVSKYVQSRIGNSYIEVKNYLKYNTPVLFSGTPCQIAGLRSFLGDMAYHENLFCIEVICHGVPSQSMFTEYVNELTPNGAIEEYQFRDGRFGWENMHISYKSDGADKVIKSIEDNFFYGFDKKYFLRNSCYECHFKGNHSEADITIGDYWGIRKEHSKFANTNGVSAVIIRNEKGQLLFSNCQEQFVCLESEYQKVLRGNPALESANLDRRIRNSFFELKKQQHGFAKIYTELEQQDIFCNIAIVGGYSSRLTVNTLHLRDSRVRLAWHIMNSTILSMTSQRVDEIDIGKISCKNPYRTSTVLRDVTKDWGMVRPPKKENWLVIDFLEERYDNYMFSDDRYITKSEAFDETMLIPKVPLISFMELSMETWKEACLAFIHLIRRYYQPEEIILNCLYLTEKHGTEQETVAFADTEKIRSINKKLESCYSFFREQLPGVHCICVSEDKDVYCYDYFDYGVEPMYYNSDVYAALSNALAGIVFGTDKESE